MEVFVKHLYVIIQFESKTSNASYYQNNGVICTSILKTLFPVSNFKTDRPMTQNTIMVDKVSINCQLIIENRPYQCMNDLDIRDDIDIVRLFSKNIKHRKMFSLLMN